MQLLTNSDPIVIVIQFEQVVIVHLQLNSQVIVSLLWYDTPVARGGQWELSTPP